MKRRRQKRATEITVSLEDLSLEDFQDLIERGLIQDEVSFDLLNEHYPELLSEWYPGYPGAHRSSTSSDPFPGKCRVENGNVYIRCPSLEISCPPVGDEVPDGDYYLWIKRHESGEVSIHGIFTQLDEIVQLTIDTISSNPDRFMSLFGEENEGD